MLHARIAARAFNTPLLVEPSKAVAFLSGLGPRVLGRQVQLPDHDDIVDAPSTAAPPARASILTGGLADSYRQQGETPFPMVNGIAVIEISGVLIHRGGWIGQSSGQTSYEGIAAQIEAAANDPAVRGVALEIDSFGGEVAGVFDLADRIRALRRDKPVWAFVAEHGFSAGYALASQADRILLPRTGALGSIGVVVMHADLSGQLDRDGVQVTLIHSGRHKVDGTPYAPLPEGARNPFDAGGYSLAEMTQAINILPNLYTRLGQIGLFRFEGVTQRSIVIEQREGVLSLLPSVPLGAPATVGNREQRSMRSFALPWIPHDDVILPAVIQGMPALGVSDAADPLVEVMNRKLTLMRRKHAQTREYMEMNALRGIVKDGAGTTLYDYFWSETTRVDLRVAEVPDPRPGDRVEIDGEAFLIQGEPVRDRERLVWTVDLRPA